LLVGDNWAYDLLDHVGTITTQLYPYTNIPCPYLQPHIVVNVFPLRPEDGDSPALAVVNALTYNSYYFLTILNNHPY
jgi:hypothetical protein